MQVFPNGTCSGFVRYSPSEVMSRSEATKSGSEPALTLYIIYLLSQRMPGVRQLRSSNLCSLPKPASPPQAAHYLLFRSCWALTSLLAAPQGKLYGALSASCPGTQQAWGHSQSCPPSQCPKPFPMGKQPTLRPTATPLAPCRYLMEHS